MRLVVFGTKTLTLKLKSSDCQQIGEEQEATSDTVVRSFLGCRAKTYERRSLQCPYLFHHEGEPIGDFRKAFDTAANAAGIREFWPMTFAGVRFGILFERHQRNSGDEMMRSSDSFGI